LSAPKKAKLEILKPTIRAKIEDIDLSETFDDTDIAELPQVFITHRVTFFEDQNLSPQHHRDFAVRFGAFEIRSFYQAHTKCHELVMVDTSGHSPIDNDHWHTDMTSSIEPPMAGILYSRVLRPGG
jgi:taurine dioxygenase